MPILLRVLALLIMKLNTCTNTKPWSDSTNTYTCTSTSTNTSDHIPFGLITITNNVLNPYYKLTVLFINVFKFYLK